MSEGQTLFLILCLLYLFDCLVWIGNRTVLFVAPWGRRWRAKFGSRLTGNDRGSVGLLNPLPPLGEVFAGHWSPISISPAGVSNVTLRSIGGTAPTIPNGRMLPFDQISRVEHDDKWLVLNGTRFARCASADQAAMLTELIRRASKEAGENRAKTIEEFLGKTLSKAAGSERLTLVTNLTSRIRWICLTFFVFLYVIVPAVSCCLPLAWCILPVAAVMWLTVPVVAVRYFRAHKTLYPARKGDRIMNVIQMTLCPPMAIRAGDLLSLDAMSRFHPVLSATLLLGDDSVARFYGPVVRDLQYPLRPGKSDSEATDVASWYADAERKAVTALLKTEQSSAFNECLILPAWDGISKSYCPRCLCQFTIGTGECPDCPGVGVMPISAARKKEATHV